MKQKLSLLVGVVIISNSLFSQTYVNKKWENTTGNIGQVDRTVSSLDNNENLIVVSNSLNQSNNTDVLITKYNPEGVVLWQTTYNGLANGDDYGVQVKINSNNEIFVASAIQGATSVDFGILKYEPNGTLLWSNTWNGSANGADIPADLDIDNTGSVYLVGGTEATNTFSDYAIVKFNSNGNYAWHTTYDYTNLHDVATSLKIDNTSLIVTGASASAQANWDFATLKLSTINGNISNTERTVVAGVGLDNAIDVITDQNSNTYITGYVEENGNRDIQTVKLNVNFGLEWVRTYDGGLEDVAKSIGIDNFGNIYIVGTKANARGGKDFITIKYDEFGNELWNKSFGSQGQNHKAKGQHIAISNNGDVTVTGSLEKNGSKDFATVKYSTNGELKFVKKFDAGNQNDEATSVIVNGDDIYVSGTSEVSGITQSSTVKYTITKRTLTPVLVNGIESHVDDEIIVSFSKESMKYEAVNNKELDYGILSDFVVPEAIQALKLQNGTVDWGNLTTYRIFKGLTTNDSTTTTRTGFEIPMPNFWSTLVISVPTENEHVLANSINHAVYPYVRHAQANDLFSLLTDDPEYPNQHSLYPNAYPNGDINLLPAWAIETGQEHVKIGIYDSGIMYNHDDLGGGIDAVEGKVRDGKDYYTGGHLSTVPNNGDPIVGGTENGHGTKVAGIIGAYSSNTEGVAGICGGYWPYALGDVIIPDASPAESRGGSLYGFRVVGGGVLTADQTASALIEGASYTNGGWGYGLNILNCSFVKNINYQDTDNLDLMYNAQRYSFRSGSVLIAGKGNSGQAEALTPAYSLKDFWVIAVGGSDTTGNLHGNSSYNYGIDIIAPFSSTMIRTTGNNSNTEYTNFSGTSASTPHVSGVAGLMMSHINDLDFTVNNLAPDDVEFLIKRYAFDVTTPPASSGYDIYTGSGLLDAGNIMTHIDRTQYVVRHYYGEQVFNTSNSLCSNCPTGGALFTDYNDGINPPDDYVVEIWNISGVHNHNLNPGDVIIDSWPLNSYTNMVEGQLFTVDERLENRLYLSGGVTQTTAGWSSTTLHLIEDGDGNPVDIWYPFGPGDLAKYGYTLHLQTNFASVDENTEEFSMSCYPNPTSGELNIQLNLTQSTDVTINIVDLQGKVVQTSASKSYNEGQQIIVLDVNSLAKGIYFVKVKVGEEIYYEKIIKQ